MLDRAIISGSTVACPDRGRSGIVPSPVDERAGVAAELLASLDDSTVEDPEAVQAAWFHSMTTWLASGALGRDEGHEDRRRELVSA